MVFREAGWSGIYVLLDPRAWGSVPSSIRATSSSFRNFLGFVLTFLGFYLLAECSKWISASVKLLGSPFWLPAGFAPFAYVRFGLIALPAIFAAEFCANAKYLWIGGWFAVLPPTFATINAVKAYAIAEWLKAIRRRKRLPQMGSLEFLRRCWAPLVVPPLLSASIAMGTASLTGESLGFLLASASVWAFGDLLGVAVWYPQIADEINHTVRTSPQYCLKKDDIDEIVGMLIQKLADRCEAGGKHFPLSDEDITGDDLKDAVKFAFRRLRKEKPRLASQEEVCEWLLDRAEERLFYRVIRARSR